MLAVLMLFMEGVQDPDVWWHLRVGRWMVENGKLPSVDLFTFTVPTHVWTDHEYLTEVLMWLLYSATGFTGLAIAFGIITWAGFWLIYRQVRRQPFVIVGLGLALAALAGWPIWGPRAQMITFALSCLELYWLQGYLSGRSRALNFFPLVMAVWANLHGGWVIGFAWLGVALVAELVGWAWDRSNPAHRAHVRFLAIITRGLAGRGARHPTRAEPLPLSVPDPGQRGAAEADRRVVLSRLPPDLPAPVRGDGVHRHRRLRAAAAPPLRLPAHDGLSRAGSAVGAPRRAVRRRRDAGDDQLLLGVLEGAGDEPALELSPARPAAVRRHHGRRARWS